MTSPAVSIIIPVVNNLQLNKDCLESIWRHTHDVSHEIVVVDNNSTDGSNEYFKNLGDKIRHIRNNELRTFAQSNNQGAKEARGEHLLFLNNDTYVTEGWLSSMLECMRSDSRIGIVGNKHLFPANNTISHAGGVFGKFGPEHIYLFYSADLPFLNQDREYQWVTAACVLVPRQLYLKVGGFCEEYRNSFEDVDLCLKLKEQGHRVVYCHKSVIYHYGLRTPGRTDNENPNKALFEKKWGGKIRIDKDDFFRKDNIPSCLSPDHRLERHLLQQSSAVFELQEHIAERNDAILGLEKHVKELNELAATLDRRLKASEENAAMLGEERNKLEAELQAVNNHLQAVYNTLSWRITRPLRAASKLLRKQE